MIISGGSRCNWRFFAGHLVNAKDNERVELAEIRGLAADNVREALREMDALASGTRCKNFFYHADINPREDEHLTPEQWDRAVDSLEKNLGLEGHSRFVVEHEKNGRTHRHVIWSRIDVDTMTAVSDSHDYDKHQRTARALESEFGQEAVNGAHEKNGQGKQEDRRPKNWETFRGKKSGIDPAHVKAEVTALWRESDSGRAFQAALSERGYLLCRADRRDFCIVDQAGDEHSLARRIGGAKAADVRARLADIDQAALPTVAEGRTKQKAAAHQQQVTVPATPATTTPLQPGEQESKRVSELTHSKARDVARGEPKETETKQDVARESQSADSWRRRVRQRAARIRNFTLSRIRAGWEAAAEKLAAKKEQRQEHQKRKRSERAPEMER